MSKFDKKTKQEINAVTLKYMGHSKLSARKFFSIISGVFIASGVLVDIGTTGGLGFAFLTSGCCGITTFVVGESLMSPKYAFKNTAAQTVKGAAHVQGTLIEMESDLQRAFSKAFSLYYKNEFLQLADEIEQDVKKLSPAFKIVSGGPKGFGTDKYEFIIDGQKRLTLDQARYEVSLPPPPPKLTPEQEEIQRLKARLEAVENPPVVRLDKKTYHSPQP